MEIILNLQRCIRLKNVAAYRNEIREYGALPRIEEKGLRNCQYEAEVNFEIQLEKVEKSTCCTCYRFRKNISCLPCGI